LHRRLILLGRASRLAFIVATVSGVLAGLCSLPQAYAISSAVDGAFLRGETLSALRVWLTLLLAVIAARGLLVAIQELAARHGSLGVRAHVRERLLRHIVDLGPLFARGEQTGELVSTATEGVEALDPYYSQYLPQLVISVLAPVGILAAVMYADPISGLVLLLTAPLVPFFMYMIGRTATTATKRQYDSLGRLASHFLDSLQGLTTLKLLGQSKAQIRNVEKVCDQFRQATLKVLQVSFLSAFALELLVTIGTAIIAVEVGLRLLYGQMQFREALFLLILAPEFYLPLRLLGMRFHAGMSGTAAAERIFKILDQPLQHSASSAGLRMRADSPDGSPGATGESGCAIEFRGVSYSYPGRERPAVRDVSFTIGSGEHVALVGASGAGKTTLINLLLGFGRPSEGWILVNGQEVRQTHTTRDHPLIAWVPQRPYLFHATVGSNITLGRPDATPEQLDRAAEAANLTPFIESLPHGYETPVGESGARLSSGQAQRLALARAFLLDAPCIALDEPTASLDPVNESLLQESLGRLMYGRTVVTIAHRLDTIRGADKILVMQDGGLGEQGTHEELLSRDGIYARLVRASEGDRAESAADTRSPATSPAPPGLSSSRAEILPGLPFETGRPWEVEPADASPPSAGPILLRLLDFAKGEWPRVSLAALLGTLTVGSAIGLMGVSAWLISRAALHPSIAVLGVAIASVRLFGISRAALRYLERLVSHGVTFRVLRRIRVWFYAAVEPLAPGGLLYRGMGDLLARATADIETLENMYVRILAPSLTAILVWAGCILFLAARGSVRIGLVLTVFFVLAGVALPALVGRLSRPAGAAVVASRGALHEALVDDIQGLADLVAFGGARRQLRHWVGLRAAYAAAQSALSRIESVQLGLSTALPGLAEMAVLMLAALQVRTGALDGLMIAPLALLSLAAFEAVGPLPTAAALWPGTAEAARRLFEIADAPSARAVAQRPAVGAARVQVSTLPNAAPLSGDLKVDDVTFRYPGQSTPALRHVSLDVPCGTHVGLVGPSGAGKSTLAHILLRLWDYESGRIEVGGVPLKELSADRVRESIGLVSSQSHFFDTSIYENLRVARRGATRGEIEQAAHQACIHDFIMTLPHGYDTPIGPHGLRVSAGELQRLEIARLFIKNAPIWILDEPTAHLDATTERSVRTRLFHLMRGRTVILITHRLVGLENLDAILVMADGRVVEQGTHLALAAQAGLYSRLWSMQALKGVA
jgi:ATP-binding cassette subfamily C protein CydCD